MTHEAPSGAHGDSSNWIVEETRGPDRRVVARVEIGVVSPKIQTQMPKDPPKTGLARLVDTIRWGLENGI